MRREPIRLMIVDDSTFVRRALIRVLQAAPDIAIVGEARDGLMAVQMARELRPDVMTLDLQMPHLNGLDVLRVIHGELPTRVIMVSSFTQEGAEETFRALEVGAFDFVDKTRVRNRLDFVRLGEDLIEKIRLAAGVRAAVPEEAEDAVEPTPPAPTGAAAAPVTVLPDGLLVLGASTGGPPAIRRFLDGLRPTFPATIVVVQHMPPGFSSGFARRLNQVSPIVVSELSGGEALAAAHAYVIPSGTEIDLRLNGDSLVADLSSSGSDDRHRPSLDRTFLKAAELDMRPKAGVVLTGMGQDGARGAAVFADHGGQLFVQDADSCVIHGMPKAVHDAVPAAVVGTPEVLAARVTTLFEARSRGHRP